MDMLRHFHVLDLNLSTIPEQQQLETVKDHFFKKYCSFFHQLIFNIYDLIFIIYVPVERGIRRNITLSDDISLRGGGGGAPREISSLRVIFRQILGAEDL